MKTGTYAAAPVGISLLLAMALAFLAGPIQAEETARTLAYHPAELHFADGRHSVLKRIQDVARLSCPRYGRVRELAEIARCQQAAVDDLVAQIGDSGFAVFAESKTRGRDSRLHKVAAPSSPGCGWLITAGEPCAFGCGDQ